MTPAPGEIRAALDTILASEAFAASERHRDLLRFLVEETLAGRGDRLKGYTIAIEVFGKDPDFDAQSDSLVRVEVGRLRKRLAEYYHAAGRDDPLRVELRRGNYAPEFTPREDDGPEPATDAPRTGLRWIRLLPALGGVLAPVGAVVLIGHLIGPQHSEASDPLEIGPPRMRVQTFANLGDPDFDYFASGLTEELLIKLDRHKSAWGPIDVFHAADLSELDISGRHDYVLEGTVSRVEDSVRVTARVVDAVSGKQIWTDAYSGPFEYASIFTAQDSIATAIADAVRDPVGAIAAAERTKTTKRPLDTLSPYECNLIFINAISELTQAARAAAKACLERHDASNALDATGLGALSYLYHLDYLEGLDLSTNEPPAIDAAYDAAQRALDRDGNNALAHLSMAFVHLDRKRWDAARRSTERMLSQNPPPSALGIGAVLLIKLGNTREGMLLFERAVQEGPRTATALYLGPALFYLEQGDIEKALIQAERIDAPEYLMFQVIWTALTAHAGQLDRAQRHAANVLAMRPDFPLNGMEILDRWALRPAALGRLIDGLRLAGIALK